MAHRRAKSELSSAFRSVTSEGLTCRLLSLMCSWHFCGSQNATVKAGRWPQGFGHCRLLRTGKTYVILSSILRMKSCINLRTTRMNPTLRITGKEKAVAPCNSNPERRQVSVVKLKGFALANKGIAKKRWPRVRTETDRASVKCGSSPCGCPVGLTSFRGSDLHRVCTTIKWISVSSVMC